MTLDEEILAGKQERTAKKLLEEIDFSDNYYNIRYSKTGMMLAEFNYDNALTECLHSRRFSTKEIIELRESAYNAIVGIDAKTNLEENYTTLAQIYTKLKK